MYILEGFVCTDVHNILKTENAPGKLPQKSLDQPYEDQRLLEFNLSHASQETYLFSHAESLVVRVGWAISKGVMKVFCHI